MISVRPFPIVRAPKVINFEKRILLRGLWTSIELDRSAGLSRTFAGCLAMMIGQEEGMISLS